MARYDYQCNVCETVVEVTCSPHDLADNWPTCPNGCVPDANTLEFHPDASVTTMGRVWTTPATIWKTHGSTQDKRGLPDVR